ncbi:MAG: hypothetical protein HZB40_13325 [Rhodocyclales bacterium]|nr:hypothetical protein [Rhodocyclales bacterium]
MLDSDAQVVDAELAALNGGLGNYAGAVLNLMPWDGPYGDTWGRFSGANIVAGQAGGDVIVSGTTVGSYTWSTSLLGITFNANATQALVNQTAQSIAYSNVSDWQSGYGIDIGWTTATREPRAAAARNGWQLTPST